MNPYRYRGYYYDTETNLYYLINRYYSPELCRFISADDVTYLDPERINGLNLYAYCFNDPISYVDIVGRMPFVGYISSVKQKEAIFSFISDPLWGDMFANIVVSVSNTRKITGEKGFLYTFYEIDDKGEETAGIGINFWDWFGVDLSVTVGKRISLGIQISPYFHIGIGIGVDGISLSMTFSYEGCSLEIDANLGLLGIITVVVFAILFVLTGGLIAVAFA